MALVSPVDLQRPELVAVHPLVLRVSALVGMLGGRFVPRVQRKETNRSTEPEQPVD